MSEKTNTPGFLLIVDGSQASGDFEGLHHFDRK
jgi:hypothetical protein